MGFVSFFLAGFFADSGGPFCSRVEDGRYAYIWEDKRGGVEDL